MMTVSNAKKLAAIGLGFCVGISLSLYFALRWSGSNGCIRISTGGQEVVYSWGCAQPQRYRQWSVIASTPSGAQK